MQLECGAAQRPQRPDAVTIRIFKLVNTMRMKTEVSPTHGTRHLCVVDPPYDEVDRMIDFELLS